MFRPRLIPILLIQGDTLVKSTKFKKHHYIGDAINAVNIFNDLKADEIVLVDINASKENRLIDIELVKEVCEEANMPVGVGGGVKTMEHARLLTANGAEKVVIGQSAVTNPTFVKELSDYYGSSTISICIDVKKVWLKGQKVVFANGTKTSKEEPVEFAKKMESMGAGEIIIQSVDRDGTMDGYDLELIKSISENVSIPVVALGGAGRNSDLTAAYEKGKATALSAGSMFVYQGSNKGVLINYPEKDELLNIFKLK